MTDTDTALPQRLAAVREEIAAAALTAGRRPGDVRLVVVTKTADPSIFPALLGLGVTDVGENRLQDAAARMAGHERDFTWHFIGHIQANKVRRIVERFDVLHGVDSRPLLERIDRIAGELGRRPEVMLQVNVSGEASKSGLPPEDLPAALEAAATLRHARVTGLMTMAPRVDEVEQTRPVFASLARLAAAHEGLSELSMGMSEDFPVAVQEGATVVRVGRRIVAPGMG